MLQAWKSRDWPEALLPIHVPMLEGQDTLAGWLKGPAVDNVTDAGSVGQG